MSKKIEILIYAVFVIAILSTVAFIFGNSMKSPAESTEQSNEVVEIVRPVIDPNEKMSDEDISFIVRKSGHFIEYMALGIECAAFAYYILRRTTPLGIVSGALGCLLVANIDEYIQSFTDRGSLVADVLLDFGGSLFGLALGVGISCLAAKVIGKINSKNKRDAA